MPPRRARLDESDLPLSHPHHQTVPLCQVSSSWRSDMRGAGGAESRSVRATGLLCGLGAALRGGALALGVQDRRPSCTHGLPVWACRGPPPPILIMNISPSCHTTAGHCRACCGQVRSGCGPLCARPRARARPVHPRREPACIAQRGCGAQQLGRCCCHAGREVDSIVCGGLAMPMGRR